MNRATRAATFGAGTTAGTALLILVFHPVLVPALAAGGIATYLSWRRK